MHLLRTSIVFVTSIIVLATADQCCERQNKKINKELRKYKREMNDEISSLRNEVRELMGKAVLKPVEKIFIGNLIHSISASWTTRCKFAVQAGIDVNADPTILPGYDFVVDACYNTSGTDPDRSSIEDIDRFVAYNNKIVKQAIPFILHGKSVSTDLGTFCAAKGCFTVADWVSSFGTLKAPHATNVLSDLVIVERTIGKIVERYGWKYVGFFYDDSANRGKVVIEQLNDDLGASGVKMVVFNRDDAAETDWASIKESEIRIFITLLSGASQTKFLCELYKNNIIGEKYMLIHYRRPKPYFSDRHLARSNCTREQIDEVMKGAIHITMSPEFYFEGGNAELTEPKHYRNGKTYLDVLSDIKEVIPPGTKPIEFAGAAYDAVWAFAIALKATFDAEGVVPGEANAFLRTKAGIEKLYANLMAVDFVGVTGHYTYNNETGIRNFYGYIGTFEADGVLIEGVGKYDAKTDMLSSFNESLIWKYKGGKPVSDGRL